jgi:hypothetical protein
VYTVATASRYQSSNYLVCRPEQQLQHGGERVRCPLHAQAVDLLTSPDSRGSFRAGKSETGSEGLGQVALMEGGKKAEVTENQAVVIGGSKDAIKATNADLDQVNQMLDLSPSAELFSALKDIDPQQAMDFAVSNPEFHQQAMHDMDDKAFEESVRLRVTGTNGA